MRYCLQYLILCIILYGTPCIIQYFASPALPGIRRFYIGNTRDYLSLSMAALRYVSCSLNDVLYIISVILCVCSAVS